MKKLLTITLLLLSTTIFAEENGLTSSINFGTSYFEQFYINFGYSIIKPVGNNTELDLKISMDIKTKEEAGNVSLLMNVPVKAGINFLFPIDENLVFLAGTGLTPLVSFSLEDNLSFLIGPNVKVGVRYKVHPSMSLFAEVGESMLIGGSKWIYSYTDMVAGLNFSL